MMIKRKYSIPIIATVLIGFLGAALMLGILYSYSKSTVQMQLTADTAGSNKAVHRTAAFEVQIDGKPTDTVNFKAYATTKLSDIEKAEDEYIANSFLPDAYQTHTITVTNHSETVTNCFLNVSRETEDDRVFYVILPDTNDILQSLYTDSNIKTLESTKIYTNSISFSDCTFSIGESKTFTMVIWAEHDAVFPDMDGNGVADENSRKLSELTEGVPAEKFTLQYTFEQAD